MVDVGSSSIPTGGALEVWPLGGPQFKLEFLGVLVIRMATGTFKLTGPTRPVKTGLTRITWLDIV